MNEFRELIWGHYRHHGRDMPWRDNPSPYRVVVSEVMLQQTQVERVTPKFLTWVERWSDFTALADASTAAVIGEWKGLGYNRRALRLQELARIVVRDYAGRLPANRATLEALPGVGPNTAGAITAYVFNQPVVFIETNIRRVFLHHFFTDAEDVHDRELLPLIEAALDLEHPREWYWALMDYGSWLKSQVANPNRRSRHHTRQAPFAGSHRQLRGKILELCLQKPHRLKELGELTGYQEGAVERAVRELVAEGFLMQTQDRVTMKT